MIGVFVTFRYGDNFDEQAVRKIAETARARFEGMPGLRSKAFTLNSGKREATNFYVWELEDAAKAFFTDELLERVTGLYGVRPTVEFEQIGNGIFDIPVTVRLVMANGQTPDVIVPLTDKQTTRSIPTDTLVREVQVNRDFAALAEFEER